MANDLCEIQIIKINNTLFPALKMRHYDEHNFKIYDAKNFREDAPKLDEIINMSETNYEQLATFLNGVGSDINFLVKNDISLGSDSFCFAMTKDNKFRLYFNDLGCIPNNSLYRPHKMSNKEKNENAKDLISSVVMQFNYAFKKYNYNEAKNQKLKEILKDCVET